MSSSNELPSISGEPITDVAVEALLDGGGGGVGVGAIGIFHACLFSWYCPFTKHYKIILYRTVRNLRLIMDVTVCPWHSNVVFLRLFTLVRAVQVHCLSLLLLQYRR